MYPPTDTPFDPLGLPPAPAAPTLPTQAPAKSMNPIAKSVLVALAAMAGPGRGTGILQGLSLADQQAQARAQQQNAFAVQDYTRQHQAYQDDQRAYLQQQTQRAATLKNVLDSFQMELGNTTSDADAESLYQTAGQLLSAQGFRGFDADNLKRKYKSPDMARRANTAIAKWMGNPINKQAFENDPDGIGRITIDVGGAPMTIAQAQAMTGGAAPTAKPKTTPAGSMTPREGVVNGRSVFFTMGPDGQPQVVQGVSPTPPAPKAPERPREKKAVTRGGAVTWIDPGTEQPGDLPYNAASQTPKEPNQAQYTTAGYASRVEQAEPILSKLESDVSKMGQMSFSAQSASPTAKFQSGTFQSYDQAARNFINAVLRRESGAAISPSEFDSARRQYLPMPGDTPETLAQKQANRRLVFANLKSASGTAYQPPPDTGVSEISKSAKSKLEKR